MITLGRYCSLIALSASLDPYSLEELRNQDWVLDLCNTANVGIGFKLGNLRRIYG